MNEETQTLIQQEFDKLPVDIKEALSRVDWRGTVREIAKAHGLDNDKSLSLETETMFILFGILSEESFYANLQSEVGLDADAAKEIEKEIDEHVFNEVEKQYEMVTALMPKTAKINAETNIAPKAAAPIAIPQETHTDMIKAPDNLPSVPPQSAPHTVEPEVSATIQAPIATPAASAEVEGEGAKAVSTPVRSSAPIHDALNLIGSDRPSDEAKDDRPIATKPSSYAPGKDPYREPLE